MKKSTKKTDKYLKQMKIELESVDVMEVWFEGEDPDEEPQLVVEFRDLGKGHYALVAPQNLSDGITFDDLMKVKVAADKHCDKLDRLVYPND